MSLLFCFCNIFISLLFNTIFLFGSFLFNDQLRPINDVIDPEQPTTPIEDEDEQTG